MLPGWLVETTVRTLGRVTSWLAPPSSEDATHLRTGAQGEDEAYFHLRRLGYTMVARNWRSPHHRGEIDLVGWEGDTLCFIEVKTRTTRAVATAEAAVDHEKQHDLRAVARDYLRHLPENTPARFDIVTVYLDRAVPEIELFRNAFAFRSAGRAGG